MRTSSLRAPFNALCIALFVWLVFPALLCSAELQVGAASVDITPNKAVALWGQFGLRLSTKPDTPLTANVVALQVRRLADDVCLSQTSCSCRRSSSKRSATRWRRRTVPSTLRTIVLTATHTHTAPVLRPGTPGIPVNQQTMTVDETLTYLADKISDGILGRMEERRSGKDVLRAGSKQHRLQPSRRLC